MAARKSIGMAKCANGQKPFKELRKRHGKQFAKQDAVAVAQKWPSENQTQSERFLALSQNEKMETVTTRVPLWNVKMTLPSLDGGLDNLFGGQNVIHMMKQGKIDIQALREPWANTQPMDNHERFTCCVSASLAYADRIYAEKRKQTQHKLETKPRTRLELFKLNAEEHRLTIVCSQNLRQHIHNIRQTKERLLVASVDTCPAL